MISPTSIRRRLASSFFRPASTDRRFVTFRRALVGLALLAAVCAGAGLPGFSRSPEEETPPPPPLPVETAVVEHVESVTLHRTYTGQLVPRRSSDLGFERGGLVVEVCVEEGDRVEGGSVLARLDTAVLAAQRNGLNAQLDAARAHLAELEAGPREEAIAAARARVRELVARLDYWTREHERLERLRTDGVATDKEYRDAASQETAAQAQLDAARETLRELENGTRPERIEAQRATVAQLEAEIERLEVDLARSVLTAPYAGCVARRGVDEGVVIAAGQAVVRLVEDHVLEARIGVPLTSTGDLQPGRRMALEVDGRTVAAVLTAILPELDTATRTRTAVLSLDADNHRLAPGQIARLPLPAVVETPGMWLPTTALVKGERGLWAVYALTSSADRGEAPTAARLERRDVEILHTEPERVFVRGLLTTGERIVARGAHRVVPGQLVQPVSADR